ncbi:MAG: hypothetical protein ACRC8A_02595 [Microcoleaceae cyanobacterium]
MSARKTLNPVFGTETSDFILDLGLLTTRKTLNPVFGTETQRA